MTKLPEMEKFLDRFAKVAFGRPRTESMAKNVCVACGGKADQFADALSAKEYMISGLCQQCQDSVFG